MVKKNNRNKTKVPMTEQEKEEFSELYNFIKREILKYDKCQGIPRELVLRLKGLTVGSFMFGTNAQEETNYSYKIILLTFQYCMPQIQYALSTVKFKNEAHKFNYILKIVERNINEIYLRYKKVEKEKNEIENFNEDEIKDYRNTFQKSNNTNSHKYDDLW